MKKQLWTGLAVGVMMLGMAEVASAGAIVDTGTNYSDHYSWTLNSEQWLAGKFSLSQAYTITNVEGYLWGADVRQVLPGADTLLHAAIYTDGGTVPGTELFSKQFFVGASTDWYGASGLNWALSTGTYWVSFEVTSGDTYDGSLLGAAVRPLEEEAYYNSSAASWYHNGYPWDNLNLAIRISGDPAAPVPEPATMLLMGSGLVGLIGARRKKK